MVWRIALKADKYAYEMRSLRTVAGASVAAWRTASPDRLDFAISGHRDVDGLIASTRPSLAESCGRRATCSMRWAPPTGASGTGRGGQGRCAEPRSASRIAQLAELVEVAYRTGGTAGVR